MPHAACEAIRLVALERIAPPHDVAERLGVPVDEESVIRRLNEYHADDEPVQLVTTYIRWSDAEITARMPTHDEAQFLQAPAGVPVLDVLHTSFDQDGEPFEVTRFVHRADRSGLVYTFDVEP